MAGHADFKRFIGGAGMLILQLGVLLSILLLSAFNSDFYMSEYRRLGVTETCGADEQTLQSATDIVTGYLSGARPDMSGEGVIDGQPRQIFGADERLHMQDVKQLFDLARIVIICSLAVGAALIIIALYLRRSRALTDMLAGLIAFICVIIIAGVYIGFNFDAAFIQFHRLLFNNELWLMNPQTQFMIRMMPTDFFIDMAKRIGTQMICALALQYAAISTPSLVVRWRARG